MKSLPSVMDVDLSEAVKERESSKDKEKRSARSVASRSFRSAKEFIYNNNSSPKSTEIENNFVIRSPRESTRSPRNRSMKGSMHSSRLKVGHKKTVSIFKEKKEKQKKVNPN